MTWKIIYSVASPSPYPLSCSLIIALVAGSTKHHFNKNMALKAPKTLTLSTSPMASPPFVKKKVYLSCDGDAQ